MTYSEITWVFTEVNTSVVVAGSHGSSPAHVVNVLTVVMTLVVVTVVGGGTTYVVEMETSEVTSSFIVRAELLSLILAVVSSETEIVFAAEESFDPEIVEVPRSGMVSETGIDSDPSEVETFERG